MFKNKKVFYIYKFILVTVFMLLVTISCNRAGNHRNTPMNESSIKQEIWETVQNLNRLWTVEGNVEKLKNYFHKDMVAITPADRERLVGRDSCIASWKRFVDKAKILKFKEIEPDIQLFGEGKFGVVTYYYDITYEANGEIKNSQGRDMFVLVNEDGKWWAVADQFSPYPDETQQ